MADNVEALPKAKARETDTLDRHWHLARTDHEIPLAEFEYALYRVHAAFERWQAECIAAVAHQPLNSTENAVLHVIRMKERPKTVAEIGRLLNRDDIPNIQYAIRKLTRSGLIEKDAHDRKRGICYQVTDKGLKVSDDYAKLRRNQLMPMLETVSQAEDMIDTTRKMLDLMKAMYDSAAVNVAAHRRPLDADD